MYVSGNNSAFYQAGYKQGIEDAWKTARRIVCFPENGGYDTDVVVNLFATMDCDKILQEVSAEDAVKAILDYEKFLSSYDSIKVGSEVVLEVDRGSKNESVKGVVIKVDNNGVTLLNSSDLTRISRVGITKITLTGKVYSDIPTIMGDC